MPDLSKPLFIASVSLSAIAAGMNLGISYINVPSLLAGLDHPAIPSQASSMVRTTPSKADDRAPRETALVLTQWRKIYAIGSRLGPGLHLGASLAFLGNAWLHYAPVNSAAGNALGGAWGTRRSMLFVAAAAVNMAIVPFTILLMSGVNSELHKREETGRGVKEEWTLADPENKLSAEGTSKELIQRWSFLNSIRALFPLAAVVLGFEAL